MLDLKLENCEALGHDGNISLGIGNGRILLIGKEIHELSRKTIDMNGKFVVPGFIDSHTHLLSLGLEETRISLYNTKNREEAIERIMSGSVSPRRIVIAYKWDESLWGDRDFLSRSELDGIKKPVIAYRRDGHMATLNSEALRLVGYEPQGDGVLKEKELRLLDSLVKPDEEERKEALSKAQEIALREGITAVRDMVDRPTYNAYKEGNTRIKVFRIVYDREIFPGIGVGQIMDWGIKTFLDGSIGARTAAHEGWNRENLLMDESKFHSFCNSIWSKNLPVAVHAIGEIAVETAVKVFSAHSGRIRNSIEHFELMPEGILDSLNASTVISSQPNFLDWAGPGGMYEDRLGKDWLQRNNPFREIIDADLPLAFGSDTMPIGPMYGIHQAVNSKFRQQRITTAEAIRCYTEGGSYALGLENQMGRIEEGFYADLAIFDKNFLSGQRNLKEIKPVATMVSGQMEYFQGMKSD